MTTTHDFDKVDKFSADDRGRITIGAEFADEYVKVYVERLQDDG